MDSILEELTDLRTKEKQRDSPVPMPYSLMKTRFENSKSEILM
jgi:hypothetical protein